MEETDLSSLSEQEIMDMYSNIIENGQGILIAKGCVSGFTSVGGGQCCKSCGGPSNYCYNGANYSDCYSM